MVFCLATGQEILCADSSKPNYKIPKGFEALLNVQEADIDLILGGRFIGQGRITVQGTTYRVTRLDFQQPVFKPDANNWVIEQCSEGVSSEGINCDEKLSSRLGCIRGNKLLSVHYSPEKLIATLIVDPVLLETTGNTLHRFISGSTANYPSAVADYTLNQSYSQNSQHYYFNLRSTLAVGERHVRAALRNVLNQTSSGSEQYGELDELYYRHDWQGRHFTAGLQNQWDFYGDLAGSQSFHPHQDVIALNWGTSSKTEEIGQSQAVFPVQVFMPEAGRVEIYHDGALLGVEAVGAGLTTLKTAYWPRGVYDVEIKTYVAGRLYDTQRQTVFKDNSGQSGKADSLWVGVGAPGKRRLYGKGVSENNRQYKALMGGSINYPLTEGLSVSAAGHLSEISSSLELGSRLFLFEKMPLISSVMVTEHQSYGFKSRLSTRFGKVSISGAYEIFQANHQTDKKYFMSDHQRLSTYASWSPGKATFMMFSVRQDLNRHEVLKTMDYRKRWKISIGTDFESRVSLQHGASKRQNYLKDDVFSASGVLINLTFSLVFHPAKGISNRLATVYSNHRARDMAVQGSYQQVFERNWLHQLSISGDVSRNRHHIWSSAGIKNAYADGYAGAALYGSDGHEQWLLFTNLSGQVGMKANALAAGTGQTGSGALLTVTPSGQGLLKTEVNGQPYSLEHERTFIPLEPYRKHRFKVINLDNGKGENELQVERDYFQCTLYPGNVVQFEVDAWRPVDIVGQVVDETGKPVRQLRLKNSRGESATDSVGMFSMTFDRRFLNLTGEKHGKYCQLDFSDQLDGTQLFYRLKPIICRLK